MVKKGKFFGGKSIFEFLSQKKWKDNCVSGPGQTCDESFDWSETTDFMTFFLDFLEM